MRRGPVVLTAAAVLVVLAACRPEPVSTAPEASAPLRAALRFGEVDVDGRTRTYRVWAPPTAGLDGPSALVFALHDAFGTADSFRQATQFDQAASAGNFVVVYPESLVGTWNGGFCCGRARADAEDIDDVGFLSRTLDELEDGYPVDPSRVYAVGASNGAIMAYRLACELADRFAGVAAVGGAMVMDDCAPQAPVSVLAIHGTDDGHVPYQGGPTSGAPHPVPSQPALADRWAALNGCTATPETDSDGLVTTSTWLGCLAGTTVRLVTVHDGGHIWFSSEFGAVAGAVDATDLIVEFFDLSS